MTVTRAEVVRVTREWIGTPYAHQHREKGIAVDCAGLAIGVGREVGIFAPDFDVNGYARSPDTASFVAACDQFMTRIPLASIQPGDVVVVRWALYPQHMGIVADYPEKPHLSVIHALGNVDGRGSVVEHRLAPSIMQRVVQAYALPGVA